MRRRAVDAVGGRAAETVIIDRVVGVEEDGTRVDTVLSGWLQAPRARVQQQISDGLVEVDGDTVAKSLRLRQGQRVRVLSPPAAPPPGPPPPPVPVRWEDDHLLIVAKPAGLLVHPGAGRSRPTLVDALTAAGVPLAPAGGTRPGVAHRLDRGTSGVLAVAKTDAALAALQALFRRHAVDRRYTALVDGVPDPGRASVDAAIARDPNRRTRFRVDPQGRPAVSHYDVEESFGRAAMVSVRLETGRTHQVRVHMSAVGHPVCGDHLYGAARDMTRDLLLQRPALHARHLGFDHPMTGARIEVDEPLPEDLRTALAILRRTRPE